MAKLIDGDAMKARVRELYARGKVDIDYLKIVVEAVSMEPEVEQKRGKWIYHDYPWRECSECQWAHSAMRRYRYCPNCGAKMDGGEDDG